MRRADNRLPVSKGRENWLHSKWLYAVLAGVVLCVLIVVVVLLGRRNSSIVGTWKHDAANVSYEFTQDGKVTYTVTGQIPESGTYTYDKGSKTLTMTIGSHQQTVKADISGNIMRVTSLDSGSVVTLTRVR